MLDYSVKIGLVAMRRNTTDRPNFVEIQGDYTKEVKEFCKYFPNLKVDESIK